MVELSQKAATKRKSTRKIEEQEIESEEHIPILKMDEMDISDAKTDDLDGALRVEVSPVMGMICPGCRSWVYAADVPTHLLECSL